MTIRPTQSSSYDLVRAGIFSNFARLVRGQEQVTTGRRILRPSDDAFGTSRVLSLRRQLGEIGRYQQAAQSGRPVIESGLAAIDESGQVLSEVRALVISAMNSTLDDADRESIAKVVAQLRERLVGLANTSFDGRYLFAGTATGTPPYAVASTDGPDRVVYQGDEAGPTIAVGPSDQIALGLSGSELFGKLEPGGTVYVGVTGVTSGRSADEGDGYDYIEVRHGATTGTLGQGIALAGSGADDTFLGTRALVVDAASGTVQFGSGTAIAIPSGPEASDVEVTDEHGAVVHLDFSGWTGADFSGSLDGAGSISLDGTTYTALDFTDTDLELHDAATGAIVHVDTTGIVRAGSDLLTFEGTVNAFDVLQGIVDDLENLDGFDPAVLHERLTSRLAELDRNYGNLQAGLGSLGARAQRLTETENRLAGLELNLKGLISNVEDADLSSVVLDITRAEQTLQLAQATGARLLQNTLLDYLA